MERRIIDGIPSDAKRDAEFQASLDKFKHSVSGIIKQCENSDNNSFINCLLKQKELYDTEEKILAEAVTATVGGSHTTGTALAWLFNYIARDLHIQQKMFDEIKHFFDVEGDIVEMDRKSISDKLKRLMYCRQVITETLRISSVAPWAARVNWKQDMVFNTCDGTGSKRKIPKGMAFIIGQGVALNDQNVFHHPNMFNPDRWSRSNLKKNKISQQSQDAIFGGLGGRKCPGWSFFRTEALIFIVATISKFKFEILNNEPAKAKFGLVAHPIKDVMVKVSKR